MRQAQKFNDSRFLMTKTFWRFYFVAGIRFQRQMHYTNHLKRTVTYRCSYEASSCFCFCSATADICFLISSTSSIRCESISSFCSRSADATARLIYKLLIKEKLKQVTTRSTSSVSENGAIIKVIPSPTLPFDIQFMGNSKY